MMPHVYIFSCFVTQQKGDFFTREETASRKTVTDGMQILAKWPRRVIGLNFIKSPQGIECKEVTANNYGKLSSLSIQTTKCRDDYDSIHSI